MVAQLSGTAEKMPEDWARRLKERERLIAVVALRGEEAVVDEKGRPNVIGMPETVVQKTGILDPGSAAILTSRVSPDGTLEWDVPEGKWQVFAFVQFPADLRVIGGVGDAPQLVLDHLKREAIDSHIKAVEIGRASCRERV